MIMVHPLGCNESPQSPRQLSLAKAQPGDIQQTPEQKPSLVDLLYCVNCLNWLGSKGAEHTSKNLGVKTGKIHKVRCGCGERFWKLVGWERHKVERRWEAPTEPHFARCEKCCSQVFKKQECFLEVFKLLLDQETAETYEKCRSATEKAGLAAADPDADPSFSTKFYSSAAIDPEPTDETNTFGSLPSFGEDEYIYEEKGYAQRVLENHKSRYTPIGESPFTGAASGPQDGTSIKRYLEAHVLTSTRSETPFKHPEKRKLPGSEADGFGLDISSSSKRMKAASPDMMDICIQ